MNVPSPAALPRILLLEDDPVSAAFLKAAIESLPARIDQAATSAEARELAIATGHDLWLFDAHLTDGLGADLLADLRRRGLRTRALAHTADTRREALDALIAAGFEEVLPKPLSVAQLQGAVRRFCGAPPVVAGEDLSAEEPMPRCGKLPVWDDAAAARALGGRAAHVDAMRDLFARELPRTAARVSVALARGDHAALRAELHMLRASCGFVGAARLGAAVRALGETPDDIRTIAQYEGALEDTASSLSG